MGDQCLNLVVTQLVFERLHLVFRTILQAVFNRGEHFVIRQTSLVLGVGLILDPGHLASLRLALAVLAVAGRTIFGPVGLDVSGHQGACEDKRNRQCSEEECFIHRVDVGCSCVV